MMRKHRRIRKEDISDPSNFVHVEHVGFGQSNRLLLPTQNSFDLTGHENDEGTSNSGDSPASAEVVAQEFKVERRNRGSRASLIPRHHRSTTAGIFPESKDHSHQIQKNLSIQSEAQNGESPGSSLGKNGSSLLSKPAFGSLLNLNFLPLGLGKSSSKSPSVGKSKRLSLLNLTAANLFASPKATSESTNGEAVHMTGFTRRRSFSDNTDPSTLQPQNEDGMKAKAPIISSTTPLTKLGRSKSTMSEVKSTMSEIRKRPKLRLKMLPPPPPVPTIVTSKISAGKVDTESEPLPSPPPSPPKTPSTAPVLDNAQILRRLAMSPPRSRVIPLPSSSSIDFTESPMYLTPAGGASPQPVDESAFPLLSPTIPQTCAPFFPSTQRIPGTPPSWPLEPMWPTQPREATITEIPSPSKEEMDIYNSEYEPAAEIVESFISNDPPENTMAADQHLIPFEGTVSETTGAGENLEVTPLNIPVISSVLRNNIQFHDWPNVAQKLFTSILTLTNNTNTTSEDSRVNEIYECMLSKTLKVWMEMAGNHATVEDLAKILDGENHTAADSLRRECLNDTAEG